MERDAVRVRTGDPRSGGRAVLTQCMPAGRPDGPAAAVAWWVLVVDLGVVEIYGGPVVGLVLVPHGSKLLGAWASS
ncbi:hypothetical protein GCM10029976_007350 [Kribbella albertanoniae]